MLTVLWVDGDPRHRRVHASYAVQQATGEPCATPSTASIEAGRCHDPDCLRYVDACADHVGSIAMFNPPSGKPRPGTCAELASQGLCGSKRISRELCPESCDSCGPNRHCISLVDLLPR